MSEGKRYYWLKLREDFFTSKRIKKLRNMAGGDTYTIIYLKMQLLALKTEGVITWTGLEDNFAEELALDLDEKTDDVEMTLMFLIKTGLIETSDNQHFLLPYVIENTGSEGASAQRWRDWKARQELATNTTALYSNGQQTHRKQIANGEKEIEKEKELEIDTEKDSLTPFDRFWSVYPKKVGKEAARKSFAKVKVDVEILIKAVEEQKRSEQWTKEGGRYIPNPATWLNQGRWQDELQGAKEEPKPAPAKRNDIPKADFSHDQTFYDAARDFMKNPL